MDVFSQESHMEKDTWEFTDLACVVLRDIHLIPHIAGLRASLVAERLKHLPPMRETQVRSLGWEDPLEKEMATHSSILAWRIPWTEEPGRLQSTGLQRVRHDWATSLHFIPGSLEKQESSRKTFISALLTMPKPLTVWITTNCGKFWKIWAYQTTWPASWETCIQVRKQQLELDMEQLDWNNRLVHRVAKSWTRLSELNWTDVKECYAYVLF